MWRKRKTAWVYLDWVCCSVHGHSKPSSYGGFNTGFRVARFHLGDGNIDFGAFNRVRQVARARPRPPNEFANPSAARL